MEGDALDVAAMMARRRRGPVRVIFGLFAIPLLLAETSFFSHQHVTAWVVVNVLSYRPILAASIAWHELGHAVAARALGLRVLGVRLGLEGRMAIWRWGNTRFQVTTFPYRAWTFLGASHTRGLRGRLWLATLAGPLVTFAILWGALVAGGLTVSDVIWPRDAMVGRLATVALIGFVNLWWLLWNLVPRRQLGGDSDGRKLLRIPRLTEHELGALAVVAPAADEPGEADDADAGDRALEAQPEAAPIERTAGSWESRFKLGYLYIRREQLAAARSVFLELVEQPPPTPEHGWIARNNLAWTDFRLRQPELLAEADELSAAVVAHLPDQPYAMGTRGAVLRWMGQHHEAIDLLESAFLYTRPRDRAQTACSLAISWAAIGWPTEARYWLGIARKNHASCPLLAEATAAVDRRPSGT